MRLLAVGLALLAMGGGYHWWLAAKIERRLAAVREAGEPVMLTDLNSYYQEVRPASNAAPVYGRAFELLLKTKSCKFLERLDELPSGSGPLPSNLREEMQAAYEQNTSTLEALDQAARLPRCRYPVDYRPGWAALLPHLNYLRRCSALEMSRGALAEQRGDIPSAIQSIDTILRFSGSLDTEPDLIGVLVQRRVEFHATELLRWLLNHRQLSAQQLSELRQLFQGVKSTPRLGRALTGERCTMTATFDYPAGRVLELMDPGYEHWSDEQRSLAVLGIYLLRLCGTWKKDELRCLEGLDEYRQALQLSLPAALDCAEAITSTIKDEAAPKKFLLTGMYLPPFSRGFQREAEGVARQRLAQTSLALERYRVANGGLPDSLRQLSPTFIPAVPVDPFTGQELLYRRDQEGYVVYSVGPDRRDDGGIKQLPRDSHEDPPSGDIIFAVAR